MARNSSGEKESKPERKYSNKYVEFLYHWETTKRLKRPVAGPPEGYQHPGAIHGQRVLRLGKGIPPRDANEPEFKLHRRRAVPNQSFQSHPDLLCPRPATADDWMHLFLDETRHRTLTASSGRHNSSSLKGAGVIVTAEPTPRKPHRARGAANPNHGLSEEMVQTLAFDPEAQQAQQQQQQQQRRQQQEQQTPPASPSRLVWTVAPVPKSSVADVLRHRMSDSAVRSREPPKFEAQRPQTPTLHSCSAEERSNAFYSGLRMYARNKVVGDYGSLRTSSGLRTLAGYAR